MKRILVAIIAVCAMVLCLTGCGLNDNAEANLTEISGVTFSDVSTVYDGTEKEITVEGELPDGVSVEYSSNKATNAGVYNATATLKGDNYKQKVLTATLSIDKADLNGITVAENQSVMFDDAKHLPDFDGILPEGVTAVYKLDNVESKGVKAVGNYSFVVEFVGQNYKTLTLNCLFKIKMDLGGLAEKVIEAFGRVPEPWSFMPKSFDVSTHAIGETVNYDNFVNVSAIPVNGIGKQMDVLYGLLNKATTALSYVNQVYAVLNTVKGVYSTFFDNNPDDYTVFTQTIGAFNITILLDGDKYTLTTSVSGVAVKIFADTSNKSYGARVQLTSSNVLKYTCGENSLVVAMNILNASGTQIQFVRDDAGKVVGYLYETIVAADKTLNETCALLNVGDDYTTIVGTKGDFIPTSDSRNVEVYSNKTGCLVGTEVREKISISGFEDMYDTLWYPLNNVVGITSIKKTDEQNGLNADKIWINGNSDSIHTSLVGGFSKKSLSRQYDIEFKKMYFYQLNSESGEYEKVVCEIPMMFIQEQNVDDFEKNFKKQNDVSVTLNVANAVKQAVNYGYYDLLSAFDAIKGLVNLESIVKYCEV